VATLWRKRSASDLRGIVSLEDYALAVADISAWTTPPLGVSFTQGESTEAAPGDFVGMSREMFGSSSVVFACMLARLSVFSAVRMLYQGFRGGRPSSLFANPSLSIFERPWAGGTTADMLTRLITDADLAGNAYMIERRSELVRLRPDWVDIVLEPREEIGEDGKVRTLGWRKIGYVYYEDGIRDDDGVILLPDEVCHFAPIPDPQASYRGMSWMTPIVREVQSDKSMTRHKVRFMQNAATPNMVIKHQPQVTPKQALEFKALMSQEYEGPENAGKTLHIGGGADLTVVGKDFREIDLRAVQGAGETRIAAAAGTPPIIVGLSEGLQSATYSNYGQARRRFADGTMHPLWGNAAGSLERIRPAPVGARLWYDARDVPFLREDAKDAADIAQIQAASIRQLVDGGFEPDSVVAAINTGDMTLLVHSGRLSVQLQTPGNDPTGTPIDPGTDAGTDAGTNTGRPLEIARG
jgi:phage portal protein BeeE